MTSVLRELPSCFITMKAAIVGNVCPSLPHRLSLCCNFSYRSSNVYYSAALNVHLIKTSVCLYRFTSSVHTRGCKAQRWMQWMMFNTVIHSTVTAVIMPLSALIIINNGIHQTAETYLKQVIPVTMRREGNFGFQPAVK